MTTSDFVTEIAPVPRALAVRELVANGIDWLFQGTAKGWVYSSIRIGTALVFLVRHADWLRPWVYLEHHRFVHGLMFLGPTAAEPSLASPMIPGLVLGELLNRWLVYARTLLSVLLLLGVRARLSAGLLALVSFTLLAADRFRYYHHLHLLYLTAAWLALAPIGQSLSLENGLRSLFARFRSRAVRPRVTSSLFADVPFWPLVLIRAQVIGVYLAAGRSKLDPSFLNGDVLRELERFHVLSGSLWETTRDLFGYASVGQLACATEFLLPVALCLPFTRRAAVVGGCLFHAGISACMPVYSFGAQMSLLLLAFWARPAPAVFVTEPASRNTRAPR